MTPKSNAPVPKVLAQAAGAGLGGALGTIAVWLLQSGGVDVPDNVASAFDTIFAMIVGFIAGYMTPPAGSG